MKQKYLSSKLIVSRPRQGIIYKYASTRKMKKYFQLRMMATRWLRGGSVAMDRSLSRTERTPQINAPYRMSTITMNKSQDATFTMDPCRLNMLTNETVSLHISAVSTNRYFNQ